MYGRTGAHADVRWVDRRGGDAYADLAGSGLRHRQVGYPNNFRPTNLENATAFTGPPMTSTQGKLEELFVRVRTSMIALCVTTACADRLSVSGVPRMSVQLRAFEDSYGCRRSARLI